MKSRLTIAFVLLCASSLHGQIAAKAGAGCAPTPNVGATLSCTAQISLDANDTLIVEAVGNVTPYHIADDCSLTWSVVGNRTQTWWTKPATAKPNCNITVGRDSGLDPYFAWVGQAYFGVASLGNATTSSSPNVPGCSSSAPINVAGNWLVGIFNSGATTSQSITASSGNKRAEVNRTGAAATSVAFLDTTGAVNSTVTLAVTLQNQGSCGRSLIELFAGTGAVTSIGCTIPSGLATNNCTSPQPLTIVANDAIVVFVYSPSQNSGTPTVNDSCNQPWLPRPNMANYLYVYTVVNAIPGNCIVTASHSGTNDPRFAYVAAVYHNIRSIDTVQRGVGQGAPGATFSTTLGLSLTNPNNIVVAGLAISIGGTITTTTGTLRQLAGNSLALGENTGPTAGVPVNVAFSVVGTSNAPYFSTNVLELTLLGASGRAAILDDQTRDVLLQAAQPSNFTLPNTLLSPVWCAWVMGTSTGPYNLVVNTPAKLNNQSAALNLGNWQMSRVCQDAHGDYWAQPPLRAGAGITITPSSTGIVIATGTRAQSDELDKLRKEVTELEREVKRLKAGTNAHHPTAAPYK